MRDGKVDCRVSKIDETVMLEDCIPQDGEFRCSSGRCIPRSKVGDGVVDCRGGGEEDELLG